MPSIPPHVIRTIDLAKFASTQASSINSNVITWARTSWMVSISSTQPRSNTSTIFLKFTHSNPIHMKQLNQVRWIQPFQSNRFKSIQAVRFTQFQNSSSQTASSGIDWIIRYMKLSSITFDISISIRSNHTNSIRFSSNLLNSIKLSTPNQSRAVPSSQRIHTSSIKLVKSNSIRTINSIKSINSTQLKSNKSNHFQWTQINSLQLIQLDQFGSIQSLKWVQSGQIHLNHSINL